MAPTVSPAVPRPVLQDIPRHSLQRIPGTRSWRCSACGVVAHSSSEWAAARHRACRGPVCLRVSTTHSLCFASALSITYCARCGAWATRKPRKLHLICPMSPTTVAAQQALLRLRQGLHPSAPIHRARGPRTSHGTSRPKAQPRPASGVSPAPQAPLPVPSVIGAQDPPRAPFAHSNAAAGSSSLTRSSNGAHYWDDPRAASILERVRARFTSRDHSI